MNVFDLNKYDNFGPSGNKTSLTPDLHNSKC